MQNLSVRFGDFHVGLRLPAGADASFAADWLAAPGQPADIDLDLSCDPAAGDCEPTYTRLDPEGFAFQGMRCAVHGSFAARRGAIVLNRPPAPERTGPLFAGLLATGYAQVLTRGGVLLHAATLLHRGRAWVVMGHSGAGKTTLAERFADTYLHDEYAFLVPDAAGGWSVWRYCESRGPREARPWRVPLAGIAVLSADRSRTAVQPIASADAFATVCVHAYHAGGAAAQAVFDGVLALVRDHPPRHLSHCLGQAPAAVLGALEATRDDA